jgi:hypothetical protein
MRNLELRYGRAMLLGWASGALLFCALGCGNSQPSSAQSTSGAPAKVAEKVAEKPVKKAATKPADVSVTGAHIGLGIGQYNHVAEEKSVFAPTDTIVLSVYSDGSAKTATIGVKWSTAKGDVLGEKSEDVVYNGSLATPFSFSMPAGILTGKHKAEVYLNDWLAETVAFEVK